MRNIQPNQIQYRIIWKKKMGKKIIFIFMESYIAPALYGPIISQRALPALFATATVGCTCTTSHWVASRVIRILRLHRAARGWGRGGCG